MRAAAYWQHPLLVIVGQAGVGKSAVRQALADRMDVPSLGPDDFEGGWPDLYARLDKAHTAVVECCRIPGALEQRMANRGATVIKLTASAGVRRERMLGRGDTSSTVTERLAEVADIDYSGRLRPDLVLTTDKATAERTAEFIADTRATAPDLANGAR